jgi:hypothetical protein
MCTALTACSLAAVDKAPVHIQQDTALDCTDSYRLPAADGAAIAGVVGLTVGSARESAEGCRQDDSRCDGQSGLLLLLAVPLAASAIHGLRAVRRCRDAQAWQRETPAPVLAGFIDRPCKQVYSAGGRCDVGYCEGGVCRSTPGREAWRRFCAPIIARYRTERDGDHRAELLAVMNPRCRDLLTPRPPDAPSTDDRKHPGASRPPPPLPVGQTTASTQSS